MSELPEPRSFDATSAQVTTTTSGNWCPVAPIWQATSPRAEQWIDAGLTHLALVQVGSQQQEKFLAWAEHELLSALRELG
jgi:hypothetical protein